VLKPALVLVVLCLAGCTRDLPSGLFDVPSLNLYLYSKDGTTNCTLERGSPQYEQLQNWANKNQSGWKSSPATYLPIKVVSAQNFSLDFLNTIAILNYSGGQFVHSVSAEEHRFLSCN